MSEIKEQYQGGVIILNEHDNTWVAEYDGIKSKEYTNIRGAREWIDKADQITKARKKAKIKIEPLKCFKMNSWEHKYEICEITSFAEKDNYRAYVWIKKSEGSREKIRIDYLYDISCFPKAEEITKLEAQIDKLQKELKQPDISEFVKVYEEINK